MSKQSRRTDKIRKRQWLVSIKMERGCDKCGCRPTNPKVLHFHHRDPSTKLFNISQNVHNYGRAKLQSEIDKCDVLCEPCHMEADNAPPYSRDRG